MESLSMNNTPQPSWSRILLKPVQVGSKQTDKGNTYVEGGLIVRLQSDQTKGVGFARIEDFGPGAGLSPIDGTLLQRFKKGQYCCFYWVHVIVAEHYDGSKHIFYPDTNIVYTFDAEDSTFVDMDEAQITRLHSEWTKRAMSNTQR